MSLAVGTKGIDSANRIDPVAAHRSGSAFQVRYSAGAATDPSNPSHAKNEGKLLQDGELQAILNSGQDFLANDEWDVKRVTGGAHAAEQDAPVTLRFWRPARSRQGFLDRAESRHWFRHGGPAGHRSIFRPDQGHLGWRVRA